MATFQPPPTWASPIIVDEHDPDKSTFNPVWLKWFIDLVGVINSSGGTSIDHNSTSALQGGQANQYYHLNAAEHTLAETILVTGLRPPNTDLTAQVVTRLFGGNGVPANGDGSDGDFYFRGDGTAAGSTVIYHKQAGAWVVLITT